MNPLYVFFPKIELHKFCKNKLYLFTLNTFLKKKTTTFPALFHLTVWVTWCITWWWGNKLHFLVPFLHVWLTIRAPVYQKKYKTWVG